MTIDAFFDNLNVYFKDAKDTDVEADIKASIYRNNDGKVVEIRIFNTKYDDIMSITNTGSIDIINIDECKSEK